MINIDQLKKYIVEPTLKEFHMHSKAAVNLLLGTAAVESRMGEYIHQINGPALGIYQMEPATHEDIYENYLKYHGDIERLLDKFNWSKTPYSSELMYNLRYATVMCRLHYYRVNEILPEADNINGLAVYWKRYYNTENGKGTVSGFISTYNKYVEDI